MNATELAKAMHEIQEFLQNRWEVHEPAPNVYQFQYVSPQCGVPWGCLAWVNPEADAFHFRVIWPLPVEQQYRLATAEFITRINYGLPNGNFALNFDDGDLRFKSSLFFGGETLTRNLIAHVVASSLEFVEMHIYGILAITQGESVEEALAANTQHEQPDTSEKPSFDDFIRRYLGSLFFAVGLPDVTDKEIAGFQAHLERLMGSQFTFGGYDGVPQDQLHEAAMRAAYEKGTLAFSASRKGMAIVEQYKQEITRRRANHSSEHQM